MSDELKIREMMNRMGIFDFDDSVKPPIKRFGERTKTVNALLLKFGANSWISNSFFEWLKANNVREVLVLPDDNRHDGDYCRRYEHTPSTKTFDSHANYYAAHTFAPLIDWVLCVSSKPTNR